MSRTFERASPCGCVYVYFGGQADYFWLKSRCLEHSSMGY